MNSRLFRPPMPIVSLVCLVGLAMPEAQALVIEAVRDIWIRESAPGTAYADDLISVWDGTTSDQRRHGVLLFDLSSSIGVTIETAFLQLYDRGDSRSTTAPLVQRAFLLGTTPPTFPDGVEQYTWEEYVTFDESGELALQGLGAYDIAAGDAVGGYEVSQMATVADIALLQQVRDAQSGGQSNLAAFILKASSGERDWGDIEYDGAPPRLVINELPAIPGDFNGDRLVNLEDYAVLTDPANWLQAVSPGTLGDVTGDGVVDLLDFNVFKPIYLEANPGAVWGTPTPEPTTLGAAALLGVASLAFASRNRRRFAPAAALLIASIAGGLSAPVACAIDLEATADVWIRESAPDTTYENDLISVWSSFGNDGARRYGIVEFDVSSLAGVPIDFAGLQLWAGANGFSDDNKPIKQTAYYIDTTGGPLADAMTWNAYQAQYAAQAIPLEGLGAYDLPQNPTLDVYANSEATQADRTLIQQVASGTGNKRLTLVLVADEDDGVDYAKSWGDGPDGYAGMNARLVINDPFPELVELTLEINTATGVMNLVNPGVDPRVNTRFDIDGYVIRSPEGSLNPAGFVGLAGQGLDGWDVVAPAAEAITELNLNSSLVLEEGDAFSLGSGFLPGASQDAQLTFEYSVHGGTTVLGQVRYVTEGYSADFDGNGAVDEQDYAAWQTAFGVDGSADANGDGLSSGLDLLIWQQQAGSGAATAASATAVPEPAAWLLASAFGLGLTARRRR